MSRLVRVLSRRRQFVSQHEPVLGTVLVLRITARSPEQAERAQRALLVEIDRLARVFSVFDPASELCTWRTAADEVQPERELRLLLESGLEWQERGSGIFNPAVGVLTERWKVAERDGELPSVDGVAELAASIRAPRYRINDDGRVVKTGDCSALNFNALAKGFVVDLATSMVFDATGVETMVVNIGGDLVHRGRGELIVGIEDPLRAYDNALPMAKVAISGQGLATSGSARRGFRIDGRWFSHVIDPRDGWPVDRVASASVIAPDAATADVVATLLSVLAPADGLALVDGQLRGPGGGPIAVGCCIVARDGAVTTNAVWDTHVR